MSVKIHYLDMRIKTIGVVMRAVLVIAGGLARCERARPRASATVEVPPPLLPLSSSSSEGSLDRERARPRASGTVAAPSISTIFIVITVAVIIRGKSHCRDRAGNWGVIPVQGPAVAYHRRAERSRHHTTTRQHPSLLPSAVELKSRRSSGSPSGWSWLSEVPVVPAGRNIVVRGTSQAYRCC